MPAKKSAPKGKAAPAKSAAPAKAAPAKKAASKSAPAKKAGGKSGVADKHKKIKKNSDLNALFPSKPRNFGIGQAIPPKRDLTRFVKWPKYVKLQRQRRILLRRIRVPPALNQFTNALDKNTAKRVFALLDKYRPEDKKAKKERLKALAAAKVQGGDAAAAAAPAPPNMVKFGLNHVTALIESKKAKLVIIAHDVEPVELVVWLPALCRRQGVPYAIVKGKSRLGQVVHQKKASCLAVVNVNKEDIQEFGQLQTAIKENFNDRFADINKKWGGKELSSKSVARQAKHKRAAEKVKAKGY
jgi:large subunit ribosomal protein L7Ae